MTHPPRCRHDIADSHHVALDECDHQQPDPKGIDGRLLEVGHRAGVSDKELQSLLESATEYYPGNRQVAQVPDLPLADRLMHSVSRLSCDDYIRRGWEPLDSRWALMRDSAEHIRDLTRRFRACKLEYPWARAVLDWCRVIAVTQLAPVAVETWRSFGRFDAA